MTSTGLLVDRWAEGWARCRAAPLARVGDAAWRVQVGGAHRDVEHVVAAPTVAEATRLAALTGTARDWLTVLGTPPDDVAQVLAGLQVVSREETMMAARLPAAAALDPAVVHTEDDGAVSVALHLDGVAAASGRAALAGGTVVLDRIATDERFRRRGLGRRVVAALTGWAVERGAADGVLIASPAGRALYRDLGWADLLPVVTYAGTDAGTSAGTSGVAVTPA